MSVQSVCLHEVVCGNGFVYVRCMCCVSSGESPATVALVDCRRLWWSVVHHRGEGHGPQKDCGGVYCGVVGALRQFCCVAFSCIDWPAQSGTECSDTPDTCCAQLLVPSGSWKKTLSPDQGRQVKAIRTCGKEDNFQDAITMFEALRQPNVLVSQQSH